MVTIYTNYPEGMKDGEITKCVREYTDEIIRSGAQVNTVWQLTPLIQLGQYELEKRQVKRITQLTIGISIFSTFVAIAALWIALESSQDSNMQREVLENIRAKLGGELTVVFKSPPMQRPDHLSQVTPKSPTTKGQSGMTPSKISQPTK